MKMRLLTTAVTLLLSLFFFSQAYTAWNTPYSVTWRGDMLELDFESSDATKAHNSANDFARLVGDELKQQFPSRILDPDVELRVFEVGGEMRFQMIWTARIVPTSIEDADYFFDRRGSLLLGATKETACSQVDEEIADSRKVETLRRSFPHGKMPLGFVQKSVSGSFANGYWCIKEYFLVAPKP